MPRGRFRRASKTGAERGAGNGRLDPARAKPRAAAIAIRGWDVDGQKCEMGFSRSDRGGNEFQGSVPPTLVGDCARHRLGRFVVVDGSKAVLVVRAGDWR